MAGRKKRKQRRETVLCGVLMIIILGMFAFIISDGIARGNGMEIPKPEEPSSSEDKGYDPDRSDPNLILINSSNILPSGYETNLELDVVQSNYMLSAEAAENGREMIAAAVEDGVELLVCSAYRSVEYQQTLFDAQVQQWLNAGYGREDAEKQAATVVAIPGYSEHHTGLCMDIVTPSYQVLDEGYGETDAAKWLKDHAHEYGFILRYPDGKEQITGIIFEPWHYRYVGTEHAERIHTDGICLEEYLQ